MPAYDYRCLECEKEYTLRLHISDLDTKREDKNKQCPKCGSKLAQRIIKRSVTAIYKGEGFTLSKGLEA